MRTQSTYLALSALAVAASAAPQPRDSSLYVRQVSPFKTPAYIPRDDPDKKARAAGVAQRADGFQYGPSLIGEASPFPAGPLGEERIKADRVVYNFSRAAIDERVGADVVVLNKALVANGGLKSLDDFANILYGSDAWKNSNPLGMNAGIMQNYTQDLLFSMERLSQNSYPLELIKPKAKLPFDVPEDTVKEITGTTLKDLKKNGNLYLVDHKYQQDLEKTTVEPKRYGAACQAYFFIHPETKDFLPLAIQTNAGKNLLYTPKDEPTDWLLAKMIFNVNDFFHVQMLHLTITHDVSEGAHQAALRTLSENHPVMIILERLMFQGYSSRPVGEELCFNKGGHWDQLFYINNVGCRDFVTDNWSTRAAYEPSYLSTDLESRGLIDEKGNYKFKSFPFYDDARVIRDAYHDFFTAFVDSYYEDEKALKGDKELKAWYKETKKGGKVHGFPKKPSKENLVEVLTHFGFIVSVVHHSLNGGDPLGSKAALPFHLNALYHPLPEEKGVKDLMPFLPDAKQAVHYIGFLATFNRPFYPAENRTLEHAFDGEASAWQGDGEDDKPMARQMGRLNQQTSDAGKKFFESMSKMSKDVKARTFDKDGLNMGMPFIYRTLDPDYIPFFSSV
jgi:hypothetical protein